MADLAQQRRQLLGHHAGNALAQPEVGEQFAAVAVAGKAQQLVPCGLVGGIGLVGQADEALGAQGLQQQPLAQRVRLLQRQRFQVVPDLGACAPGFDKTEPARVGLRVRRGEDLYHIAIFEPGAQGHLFAVDFGPDGAVAHVGVDGVGKIHHRGPVRQREDAALGREHIDRIREQVDFDVVPELGCVLADLLDVKQRLQPARVGFLLHRTIGGAGLVEPVRGHARFGHHIHGRGAQLELDVGTKRPHQRGVQRLVAIHLGDGDVVAELVRQRFVNLVQDAQRPVAIEQLRQDDAKAVEVGDLGKGQVLAVHFVVDGKQRFFAPDDARFQPVAQQGPLDFTAHFGDQILAPVARFFQRLGQRLVAPRVQVLEGEVLQLAVVVVQAQAVRDGGVDFQRFGADAAPFAARHVAQGAHVVGAVGQLDEDHAHVARHGQQHLAKGFGLVLLAAVEFELVELGQSIDQVGHLGAKLLHQVGFGAAAVFEHIVHQGRAQGLGVELPLGALQRDGNRVRHVGVAVVAQLPRVGLVGKAKG